VHAMEEEGRLIAEQDPASEDDDDEQVFGTTTSEDDSMISDGQVTVTSERVTQPEVRDLLQRECRQSLRNSDQRCTDYGRVLAEYGQQAGTPWARSQGNSKKQANTLMIVHLI
jgi:hypothetical protein